MDPTGAGCYIEITVDGCEHEVTFETLHLQSAINALDIHVGASGSMDLDVHEDIGPAEREAFLGISRLHLDAVADLLNGDFDPAGGFLGFGVASGSSYFFDSFDRDLLALSRRDAGFAVDVPDVNIGYSIDGEIALDGLHRLGPCPIGADQEETQRCH
jgi:hypothetical protein